MEGKVLSASNKRNRKYARNRKKRKYIESLDPYSSQNKGVRNPVQTTKRKGVGDKRKRQMVPSKLCHQGPREEISFGAINIDGLSDAADWAVRDLIEKREFDVSLIIIKHYPSIVLQFA